MGFLTALEDLKVNRRISSETKAIFEPFLGQEFVIKMLYGSSIRTFGNHFDPVYDSGYTVSAKIEDQGIDISLLLDPSENRFVESLNPGDHLEYKVTALDFDDFYQKAVLGYVCKTADSRVKLLQLLIKRQNKISAAGMDLLPTPKGDKTQELPVETVVKKEGDPQPPIPSKSNLERKKIYTPLSPTKQSKTGPVGAILAVTGIAAAGGAAWGWTNEYDFLEGNGHDSPQHWILWATLTFPLALGLPCIAKRAWKSLFITICAFAFDLLGTFMEFKDNEDITVEFENGLVKPQEYESNPYASEEAAIEIADGMPQEESPGKHYYNLAMILQAIGVLGLAHAVSPKTVALLLAWAYLVISLLDVSVQNGNGNETLWALSDLFIKNHANIFLALIIVCSVSTLIEGMTAPKKQMGHQ